MTHTLTWWDLPSGDICGTFDGEYFEVRGETKVMAFAVAVIGFLQIMLDVVEEGEKGNG